jgi:alkanesulfonate monooxygenase SsuD/methylene tetrahydromethanopterin reductase-like flavin-dependent oxidoreductase (luciferase family)
VNEMQFFHFGLMPYPFIPPGSEIQSTWVTLSNKHYDPKVGARLYKEYLDQAVLAEKLGYDGTCVNEHHQNAYGTMPDPNVMGSQIVARTSRIPVGIIGNALPLHSNPVRVAEAVAMLDVLSEGRIISGFVRGTGMEYHSMRANPAYSRERFWEAHDLIIKAWTSTEPFEWWGKHYEFRYVNVWPRPLQTPHPDIYIPGAGSRETMKYCAEKRYTFMGVYAPTPVVKGWFDGYRSAAADLGYEPDPEKIALSIPIYVAEDHEQAHREARHHVEFLFHKALKQGLEIVLPPGYMSEASLRGMLSAGPRKSFGQMSYEDLLENGMVIVGNPESVAEQVARLQGELGFGQIMALMCIGDMPHERVVRTMELFAREVAPEFRSAPVPA